MNAPPTFPIFHHFWDVSLWIFVSGEQLAANSCPNLKVDHDEYDEHGPRREQEDITRTWISEKYI